MQSPGYELLYLVPSTKSAEEIKKIKNEVAQILEKAGAKVLEHEVWSSRKLAYAIKRIEHATYILAFFTIDTSATETIKKTLLLSSDIVRSMVISHTDVDVALKAFHTRNDALKRKKSLPKTPRLPHVPHHTKPFIRQEQVKAPRVHGTPFVPQEEIKKVVEQEVAGDKEAPEIIKEKEENGADAKVSEKPVTKKRSLEELDKKLEDILGGEIEL